MISFKNNNCKTYNDSKGVTVVASTVIIIVLLILAGISIRVINKMMDILLK